jgi:hypothetical protein
MVGRDGCEGVGSADGGFGVEGDAGLIDFLDFGTGREGSGPVGGRDGRGRAVAAIIVVVFVADTVEGCAQREAMYKDGPAKGRADM